MSFGVSSSDLLKFLSIGNQVKEALQQDSGSKAQFQEFDQNNEALLQALSSVTTLAETADATAQPGNALHVAQVQMRQRKGQKSQLDRYREKLGENSPKGKRHGIMKALHFSFSESKALHQREVRNSAGTSAMILETVQYVL